MNKFRSFFALFVAIMAISFVSANAFGLAISKPGPSKTIEQQVSRKLRSLFNYNVFDYITYQVAGNTVTLNGKVNSLGTRSEAESVVKHIPGVTNVVNNIENLPPSSFDDSIRIRTLRTFVAHGPSQYFSEINPDVRIIVDGGNVTLEGFVTNSGDYNRLNILANSVSGVFHVQNNLVVGKDVDR